MDDNALDALDKLLKEEKERKEKAREEEKRRQKDPRPADPADDVGGLSPGVTSKVLDSLNPRDVEVAADTFNPSALFEDKSQAEWFGNIVANVEAKAIQAMHAAANKIPRWVWILVLVAGAMVGFIAALWLMGGLAGHATTTAVTTKTSVSVTLPPPPTG